MREPDSCEERAKKVIKPFTSPEGYVEQDCDDLIPPITQALKDCERKAYEQGFNDALKQNKKKLD